MITNSAQMTNKLGKIAVSISEEANLRNMRNTPINYTNFSTDTKKQFLCRQAKITIRREEVFYTKTNGTNIYRKYENKWTQEATANNPGVPGTQNMLFFIKYPEKPWSGSGTLFLEQWLHIIQQGGFVISNLGLESQNDEKISRPH